MHADYAPYQMRFALHVLISVCCIIVCISFLSSHRAAYNLSTVIPYGVVALAVVPSDIAELWRKRSIASSIYVEVTWSAVLVAVSIASLTLNVWFNVTFAALGDDIHDNMGFDLAIILPLVLRCAVVVLCTANLALTLYFSWPLRLRLMPCNRAAEPFHKTDAPVALMGTRRPDSERRKLLRHALHPLVFQHTVFRKHPYESAALALVRGVIGMAVLVALGVYGVDQVIVLPVLETRSYPVRYTTKGELDSAGLSRYMTWEGGNGSAFLGGIAYVMSIHTFTPDVDFGNATTVHVTDASGSTSPCTSDDQNFVIYAGLYRRAFQCNSPQPRAIDIRVDYTNSTGAANEPASVGLVQADLGSAHVLPTEAFDAVYDAVLASLSAFALANNTHVSAGVTFQRRRVLRRGPWWRDAMGVGAEYKEFDIYSLVNALPAEGAFAPGTASLSIYAAFDASSIVYVEDYREHTVLGGLGAVGGVYTVADGVFAALFGSTLGALLFGSKPLSPFGATGVLARGRIHAAVHERYPLLKREVGEGGMASFLRDTAVELDILGAETKEEDPREEEEQEEEREGSEPGSSQYSSLAQVDHS